MQPSKDNLSDRELRMVRQAFEQVNTLPKEGKNWGAIRAAFGQIKEAQANGEFDDIEQDIEPADDHGIELIYSEIADSQIQLSFVLGGQGNE